MWPSIRAVNALDNPLRLSDYATLIRPTKSDLRAKNPKGIKMASKWYHSAAKKYPKILQNAAIWHYGILKQIHLDGFGACLYRRLLPWNRHAIQEPFQFLEIFLKQRAEIVVVKSRGGMEQRKQLKLR